VQLRGQGKGCWLVNNQVSLQGLTNTLLLGQQHSL